MLRIAGSLHRDLGHCSFDVAEIAHRQCDTRRSDILLQPVEFCRARDGHDPELLSQQPCKRDLSGRGFLFRCNVAEQIDRAWFALRASGANRGTMLRKSVLSNFVFSLIAPVRKPLPSGL